jgi:hypothetical protein
LIKKEAKDACARLHSGIRLSVINEVNKDNMDEEDDIKRNKPAIKPLTILRRWALEEVVYPYLPPPTIARVVLILVVCCTTPNRLQILSMRTATTAALLASTGSKRTMTKHWSMRQLRMLTWGLPEKLGKSTLVTTRAIMGTTPIYFWGSTELTWVLEFME